MSADGVAHGATIDLNLPPLGFRHWARHFLVCRRGYVPPDSGFSPVPYFLDCRAIELEFKARHLETLTRRIVKDRFGHNLEASYNELPLPRQTLSPDEVKTLRRANNIYSGKGFEYFDSYEAITGFRNFPDLSKLDALALKLVPL
jgi:hypothetical protein